MSEHTFRLHSLCRLCGERVKRKLKDKFVTPKLYAKYVKDILSCFEVDVQEDSEHKHPRSVCQKCYRRVINRKTRPNLDSQAAENATKIAQRASSVWTDYDPTATITECTVCSHFHSTGKGGRPQKVNKQVQKRNLSDGASDISFLPSFTSASTPVKSDTVPSVSQSACMPPSAAAPVRVDTATSPLAKQYRGLRPIHQLSAPLSKEEELYLTQLVRIKMKQSADKMTVHCKTRGQPLVLMKIIKPRKSSLVAPSPLKRKRARLMAKLRLNVSGNTAPDAIQQQGTELKRTSKARKKIILNMAGCKVPTVNKLQGPALRIGLGLSWRKYKQQKRFFRKVGVKFASEQKERQQQRKAMCGEVQVERRSLGFYNEVDDTVELRRTPVAFIRDIPQFVQNLLQEHKTQGNLTWQDGAIPEEEVWIKLGGDHGGGTFKLMLQVANVRNPNSKHNTCLLTVAECKDTPDNLRRILSPYKDQIETLKTMQWDGKRVRLFLFGDYDFLLKLYGLSGAQSVHPCLYCLASKAQIQSPPVFNQGNINERNLAQIERDYDKFRRSGRQKTKAKLFNNVVRKPLLDVEIDHVAPPYLHILLGIVKKHHDLIQKECHYLDEHVAQSLAKTNEDFSSTQVFQDYVQQLREIEEQSQKHQRLETRLTMYQPEDDVPLATTRHEQQQLSDRIERLQCKIAEMKDKVTPLPNKSGSITANLESVLNNNKIYVQAYHSGSFVGNHCHKYLKPQVFTQICDSIVSKSKELTTDRGVIVRAQSVCDKFQALNSLFSDVHHRLSHQLPIPSTEADEIERCVKLYMSFFRQQFPQVRVTPKQHLLESHCVPWIRKWSLGMALHGEQGGEETHATVNILRNRVWGLKSKEEQLRVLMTEHMALVSPLFHGQLLTKTPTKKRPAKQ